MSLDNKIKNALEKATNENYIDFGEFELFELPHIPTDLFKIKYLFLNDNKLTNINFNSFDHLLVIDISNNLIEKIDFLPENLEELVCNNCELTFICSHEKLKRLHCFDNKIENLQHYSNLKDLKCDNNMLKLIPTYYELCRLSCINNPITIIEPQPLLTFLDCSETHLSGTINNMPKLCHLVCINTRINNIANLTELVELEFMDSDIKNIPFLKNLKSIILNNKQIQLSHEYKIKNFLEYASKTDIVFV